MPNRKRMKIQIISMHGGGYRVLHYKLEKAVERYDFSQEENVARFTKLLRRYKVEETARSRRRSARRPRKHRLQGFQLLPGLLSRRETYDEEPEPELEEFGDGGGRGRR